KSLASQLAPELNLADDLDPAAQHPSASQDYFNFHTGEPQSLTLANGYVHFHEVPGGPEGGPLLLGRMEKLTASREAYLHFHQTVMHNQHLARMRASLPALLLLTLCSVGLGVLFLYQLNMNRKGGIRLYLLRRRQAAAWAAMQGRHVSAAVGAGAKAVHRYQASGNGRRTPPRKSVPQGIRTKK
ncbi:MAG TPA: hypothetical protein VEI97_00020, partial [bacterium]|nr:hypothetical protein [bacterium]